jgi:hypothetical protein
LAAHCRSSKDGVGLKFRVQVKRNGQLLAKASTTGGGLGGEHKKTDMSTYHTNQIYHGTYAFNWLTWALLTNTPVLGLASNTTFGFIILAITTGCDHLNNNLAVTLLALELANLILIHHSIPYLIPMRFTINIVSLSNSTPGPFQITVGLCPKRLIVSPITLRKYGD